MTQSIPASVPCSDLAFDQALAGTAPPAVAWVIFEYAGSWSRDALSVETFASDPLGPEVLQATELLESLGARVLLAREPGALHAPLDRDSRAWVAGVPEFELGISTIGGVLGELARSPATALPAILTSSTKTPPGESHLFVCCHAKRDQCCAVRGRAFMKKVQATHTQLWECSHLGGHRFAPTALLLPHGAVFGRLTGDSMNSILAGTSRGLSELRGLSALNPAEQVVDVAAKQLWDLSWSEALSIERLDSDGNAEIFGVMAPDGSRVRCTVMHTTELLPVSCGKSPSATDVWRVVELLED